MSNRPTPPHHKMVRVDFSFVANGYGGDRQINQRGFPGWWQIVAAAPSDVDTSKGPPPALVEVIVAPARGPR